MEKKKVLIIDDVTDFCLLIKHYLERSDCKVVYVHSFSEGIELVNLFKPEIIYVETNLADYDQKLFQETIDAIESFSPEIIYLNTRTHSVEGYDQGTLLDEFKKAIDFIKRMFKK